MNVDSFSKLHVPVKSPHSPFFPFHFRHSTSGFGPPYTPISIFEKGARLRALSPSFLIAFCMKRTWFPNSPKKERHAEKQNRMYFEEANNEEGQRLRATVREKEGGREVKWPPFPQNKRPVSRCAKRAAWMSYQFSCRQTSPFLRCSFRLPPLSSVPIVASLQTPYRPHQFGCSGSRRASGDEPWGLGRAEASAARVAGTRSPSGAGGDHTESESGVGGGREASPFWGQVSWVIDRRGGCGVQVAFQKPSKLKRVRFLFARRGRPAAASATDGDPKQPLTLRVASLLAAPACALFRRLLVSVILNSPPPLSSPHGDVVPSASFLLYR